MEEKITINGITYIREDLANKQSNPGKQLIVTNDNLNEIMANASSAFIKDLEETAKKLGNTMHATMKLNILMDAAGLSANIRKLYLTEQED